jgi:hypothetical protein
MTRQVITYFIRKNKPQKMPAQLEFDFVDNDLALNQDL